MVRYTCIYTKKQITNLNNQLFQKKLAILDKFIK